LSSKTNLLIALSPKQNLLTSLAPEFSLVLPPPGSSLVSYFPERKENISVVPVEVPSTSNIISASTAPIWFSGVPFTLGNNPLVFPILKAPEESFAADSEGIAADALADAADKGGEGLWAGSQLAIAAGFQTLGNARVAWVGGVELFSDEFARRKIWQPTNCS
jgi:oligosaccharyltransferase complex subunit beta